MVSEGVDIPRLRVGVYATAAKTPLIFRQIVGRFVRTIPGAPGRPELAVPARRPRAARARRRRRERPEPVLRRRPRRRGAARRAPRARARPSRPRRRAFVPLAADVDAAAGAVRRRPAAPRAPCRVRRAPVEDPRRPRSRPSSAARSCATSATASSRTCAAPTAAATPRSTAGSTAPCGIRRVEDASIDQLERSIELLLGALGRGAAPVGRPRAALGDDVVRAELGAAAVAGQVAGRPRRRSRGGG